MINPDDDDLVQHEENVEPKDAMNDIMNDVGWSPFTFEILFICGIGWITDGCENSALTYMLPALEREMDLSSADLSVMASVIACGQALGASFWGAISDIVGRRKAFIASLTFTFIFGIGSAFCPNFGSYVAVRCLMGFAVGGNLPLVITLASEFLPPRIRNECLIGLHLMYEAGELFATGLAAVMLPASWRFYLIMLAVPAVVTAFIAIARLPESPHWLLEQGRGREAAMVLDAALLRKRKFVRQFQGKNTSSEVNGSREILMDTETDTEVNNRCNILRLSIIRAVGGSEEIKGTCLDTSLKSTDDNEQGEETNKNGNLMRDDTDDEWQKGLRRLISPELRASTTCLCIWWYVLQIASGWWTWAPIIVEDYVSHNTLYTSMIMARCVAIFAFLFATALVNYSYSAWLVLIANIGGSFVMSGLITFFLGPGVIPELYTLLYLGFALFFGGTWPIMYVLSPQAFPTIARGAGFGVASAFAKVGSITLPFYVALLLDRPVFLLGGMFTLCWGFCVALAIFQSKQPRYLADRSSYSGETLDSTVSSVDVGAIDESGGSLLVNS